MSGARRNRFFVQPGSQQMTDGTKVPADRCCHPTSRPIEDVLPADIAEDEGAAEAQEDVELAAEFEHVFSVPGDGDIAVGATEHHGWKVSYRQQEPELRKFPQWCKRWHNARERWERSGKQLSEPQIRRTPEAQLKLQQSWRERKRHRKIPAAAPVAAALGAA